MIKRHGFQYDKIFGKKEWYIEELDFDKAEQGVSTDLYFPRYYGIKSEEHARELCDLLNEQDNEIQRCKLAYNQLSLYVDMNFDEYMTQKRLNERIRELEKENEQLKKELCNCEEDYILEEYL